MESFASLSTSVSIIHRSNQIVSTASCVCTMLMYGISFWSGNTDVSICRSPSSSTCLVYLTWMVCDMRDKWPYTRGFVACCFDDSFKIAFLCSSWQVFSLCVSLESVVHLYSSTGSAAAQKNSDFILSEIWSLYDQELVHAYPVRMLILLSVDVILLLRYVKDQLISEACYLKRRWHFLYSLAWGNTLSLSLLLSFSPHTKRLSVPLT